MHGLRPLPSLHIALLNIKEDNTLALLSTTWQILQSALIKRFMKFIKHKQQ